MRTVAPGIPAASEDISLPPVISGSDSLTFLLPHCGPCDNFCYLGHIKKLVDDDDDRLFHLMPPQHAAAQRSDFAMPHTMSHAMQYAVNIVT